ncbi:MAG: zinc ribbon domain-containing protein [Gemmatimonadaceae bacterium]
MPTYDYQCRACQHAFARREKIADHDASVMTCPKCGSPDVDRVIGAGVYARTPRKS